MSGSSTSGLRWDFKEWKRKILHQVALESSFLQAMGMVGTEKVLPLFGPALGVQDQL